VPRQRDDRGVGPAGDDAQCLRCRHARQARRAFAG
jgi:hypothetical protein